MAPIVIVNPRSRSCILVCHVARALHPLLCAASPPSSFALSSSSCTRLPPLIHHHASAASMHNMLGHRHHLTPSHTYKLHTTTGSFACHIHARRIHAPACALHPLPAHSTHVPPPRTCAASPPSSFAASPPSSCAMSRRVSPLTHARYHAQLMLRRAPYTRQLAPHMRPTRMPTRAPKRGPYAPHACANSCAQTHTNSRIIHAPYGHQLVHHVCATTSCAPGHQLVHHVIQ